MFAFYCMANQLQCQISEVILGGETFCKERLLKKNIISSENCVHGNNSNTVSTCTLLGS